MHTRFDIHLAKPVRRSSLANAARELLLTGSLGESRTLYASLVVFCYFIIYVLVEISHIYLRFHATGVV